MKKVFLLFASLFFLGIANSFAQATEEQKKGNKNDQEALDESMLSPEDKKKMKAYEKQIKKARKEKEKKNEATRKQVDKKSKQRLNKANTKTRKKKKRYVKTH